MLKPLIYKSVIIQTTDRITFVPSVILCQLIFFLSVSVFCSLKLKAQTSRIQQHLEEMDKSLPLKQASWGFCLLSGKTGKQIAGFDTEKSLVPASVQKVMTTSAAIAILGDTFRIKTELWYEGNINEGILNGNLIVKGYGNPVAGSLKGSGQSSEQLMEEFAGKLKTAGIKRISGKIIADVSYFEYEPVPAAWTWYDMGNYYAPQIGALNIGENQYELWFDPGKKVGDSTRLVKTVPKIEGLKIINHTTNALGGGDQTYIPGPPRSMEKHIYGKMPAGESFKVKGAIPQPEVFFLTSFRKALKSSGIETSVENTVSYLPVIKNTFVKLHTHFSPPLAQLCQYANFTSNNLAAECLLRILGAEKRKEGSTKAGLEVVNEFQKSRTGNMSGLKQVDGSGLSKYNLINARQLATYLYSISKENWSTCFINTLPTSGTSGTLEKFCDGNTTSGKVFAKSGSMERVKCYAGYVKDSHGILNPFAIMVNNHDVANREIVKLIEGLMELCVQ